MPVWVVTGKLGAGKTLMSVSRIQKYLLEGRKVATNLNIHLENMLGYDMRHTQLYRLPDIPTIESLKALPLGYEGNEIDEKKNGLLVLDETGIFFDSRNWNDPKRKPINAHFKLLRKLRWDAVFIIQDIDNLDSDMRRTIAEHTVYCRRMDRMRIPIISGLFKLLTTYDLPMPQLHMGIVKYGTDLNSMTVDNWKYYGRRLYDAYDTEQLFSETENYSGIHALTSILPPWYTHGRYISKWDRVKNAIRNFKVKGIHFFSLGALAASFAVNALVTFKPEVPQKGIWSCNDAYKQLYGSCSAKPVAPYEYYYPKESAMQPDGAKVAESNPAATIYISGWEIRPRMIYMAFVTSSGEPYYPLSYRVKQLGNCVAMVEIEGVTRRLNCMPDDMAYPSMARISEPESSPL